jgi:hypothetical protein
MVKLITICNTAIAAEKETLWALLSDEEGKQLCNTSISEIRALKEKLKSTLLA